jgi:hypothetical protein
MTITLDIKPEVQAELARQAAAQGREIESYAATLLEAAVHLPGWWILAGQLRRWVDLRLLATLPALSPFFPALATCLQQPKLIL